MWHIRTHKAEIEKLHVSMAESTAKIEELVRQADHEREVARARVEAEKERAAQPQRSARAAASACTWT